MKKKPSFKDLTFDKDGTYGFPNVTVNYLLTGGMVDPMAGIESDRRQLNAEEREADRQSRQAAWGSALSMLGTAAGAAAGIPGVGSAVGKFFNSDSEDPAALGKGILEGVGGATSIGGQFMSLFAENGGHIRGTYSKTGLLELNGDSHDEASGGIDMTEPGSDIQTLVEGGETVFNDFVYTNSRNVEKGSAKQYKLPKLIEGLTFADASKKLAEDYNMNINNANSKKSFEQMMGRLEELHMATVPESRPENQAPAAINNAVQGAASFKFGGDYKVLAYAKGGELPSMNLLETGGVLNPSYYLNKSVPRGIRNNNPGNLRHGQSWEGLSSEQPDAAFDTFNTPEFGVRAMWTDVYGDVFTDGLNNLNKLMNEYAPSSENDTESYIRSISQATGIDPKKNLTAQDLRRLLPEMIRVENGDYFGFTQDVVDRGISIANMGVEEAGLKSMSLDDYKKSSFYKDYLGIKDPEPTPSVISQQDPALVQKMMGQVTTPSDATSTDIGQGMLPMEKSPIPFTDKPALDKEGAPMYRTFEHGGNLNPKNFLNKDVPRGIRNNNPGNLRHGQPWQGLTSDQPDKSFDTFETPEFGVRAMWIDIYGDVFKDGNNTLNKLINEYAPPSENNTTAYINALSQKTGIDPNKDLTAQDLRRLVPEIIRVENGDYFGFTQDVIDRGIALANIGVKEAGLTPMSVADYRKTSDYTDYISAVSGQSTTPTQPTPTTPEPAPAGQTPEYSDTGEPLNRAAELETLDYLNKINQLGFDVTQESLVPLTAEDRALIDELNLINQPDAVPPSVPSIDLPQKDAKIPGVVDELPKQKELTLEEQAIIDELNRINQEGFDPTQEPEDAVDPTTSPVINQLSPEVPEKQLSPEQSKRAQEIQELLKKTLGVKGVELKGTTTPSNLDLAWQQTSGSGVPFKDPSQQSAIANQLAPESSEPDPTKSARAQAVRSAGTMPAPKPSYEGGVPYKQSRSIIAGRTAEEEVGTGDPSENLRNFQSLIGSSSAMDNVPNRAVKVDFTEREPYTNKEREALTAAFRSAGALPPESSYKLTDKDREALTGAFRSVGALPPVPGEQEPPSDGGLDSTMKTGNFLRMMPIITSGAQALAAAANRPTPTPIGKFDIKTTDKAETLNVDPLIAKAEEAGATARQALMSGLSDPGQAMAALTTLASNLGKQKSDIAMQQQTFDTTQKDQLAKSQLVADSRNQQSRMQTAFANQADQAAYTDNLNQAFSAFSENLAGLGEEQRNREIIKLISPFDEQGRPIPGKLGYASQLNQIAGLLGLKLTNPED